jgi:ribosome-binding protein aMBF1 (putative translation factor)
MKPQIIYEDERPAFVVLPYQEYMQLAADDDELIPFDVADYIANPLKAARIDAGLTQLELADRLNVSQAYIAKIEAPSYKPSDKLIKRVDSAITT